MSTSWDVYCRTCDTGLGLDVANSIGEKAMADLIRLAPLLLKLLSAKSEISYEDWPIEFAGVTVRGSTLNLEWFQTHLNHDLVARNEYGELSDQCNTRERCVHCGSNYRCVLALKHDGQHAGVKPR